MKLSACADRALGLQCARLLERRVVADEQDEVADVAAALDRPAGRPYRPRRRRPADPWRCARRRLAVGQPDADRAVIGVGRAVAIFLAVMVDDDELALLDELAEHLVEQPHGGALIRLSAQLGARGEKRDGDGDVSGAADAARRGPFSPGRSTAETVAEILDARRAGRRRAATSSPGMSMSSRARALDGLKARVRASLRRRSGRARGPNFRSIRRPCGEPWRGRRFASGEQLYAAIGIPREDRPARLAPVRAQFRSVRSAGRAVLLDPAHFGPPQWAHLGMFMQNVMLLAEERGLATCAQEAWALVHKTVGGVSRPARGPALLLRHGARLCRRSASDQRLADRARAAGELRDLSGLLGQQRACFSSAIRSSSARLFFSAADFSWPQAAMMSRPRGRRIGAEMPASKTMSEKRRIRSSSEHS